MIDIEKQRPPPRVQWGLLEFEQLAGELDNNATKNIPCSKRYSRAVSAISRRFRISIEHAAVVSELSNIGGTR